MIGLVVGWSADGLRGLTVRFRTVSAESGQEPCVFPALALRFKSFSCYELQKLFRVGRRVLIHSC